MSEVKVIDISAWNDNINHSLIKSAGVNYALLRITEKNNKKDSMFDKHISGLKTNNIEIMGGYKFSYAMNINELRQEANCVVDVLKKYPEFNKKVVFLDLEYEPQVKLGKATLAQFAKEFKSIIEKAGYKFAIYASTSWYDYNLDISAMPYDYWLASYPYNDTGEIVERLRPHKQNQVGWQYSSHFPIGNNRCDMSVFNKDYVDGIMKKKEVNNMPKVETKEIDIETIDTTIESAVSFMEKVARDNTHGYDQIYRWNERGDYDCSSLVISAWEQAGVPVKTFGATYTGNMYDVFIKNGFIDVTSQVNMANAYGMKRGDVLLNHVHHTAMYCGDGLEVEASINERGGATGGQPGDQTGREILIRDYRNYPWNSVLRYVGSPTNIPITSYPTIQQGSTGAYVKKLQQMLAQLGYGINVDSDFGSATKSTVIMFQKVQNLEQDGIVGSKTWKALQKAVEQKAIIPEEEFVGPGEPEVDGKDIFTEDYPKIMYVINKPGVVRNGSSKKAKAIARLGKNTKVAALGEEKNDEGQKWCKVAREDFVGYIISDNLRE